MKRNAVTVSTYTYGLRGELGSVRFGSGSTTESAYLYDGWQQLLRETMTSAGIVRDYSYDDAGSVSKIDVRVQYTSYEKDGDLLQEKELVSPTAFKVVTTAPQTRDHTADATRDILASWTDEATTHHARLPHGRPPDQRDAQRPQL